jgi:hypothetical protein
MAATQNRQTTNINGTRWKIGWHPLLVILPLTVVGAALGYAVEEEEVQTIGMFAVFGAVVGIAIAYWGAQEVNNKYLPLVREFREQSHNRLSAETGGVNIQSAYNFLNPSGTSPFFITPHPTFHVTHILISDESVIINKEFQYDLEDRTGFRGGEQSELFYDQISNIHSENYQNKATLELSLSSGQVIEIPSRDPGGVETVKSEIQQHMRQVRRK